MLGETPTNPSAAGGTKPSRRLNRRQPAIDAPVPPFLQTVLSSRAPEPVPPNLNPSRRPKPRRLREAEIRNARLTRG